MKGSCKVGFWGTLLIAMAFFCFLPSVTGAGVPQFINYQGKLWDTSGAVPLPVDGAVTMTFRIYSVPTGGAPLWSEIQTIIVIEGVYSVNLGQISPLDFSLGDQYYLTVSIGSGEELTPRQPIGSVAFALRAGSVDDAAITSAKISPGSITTEKITDSAVTEMKIATGAITNTKIASGSVTSDKLSTDSVSTNQIQNSAVTETKIATWAVTSSKIASGSVTSDKLSTDSVSSNQIQNSAVTEAKISAGSVSTNKIQDSAVTEGKIATGAITNTKIASGSITSDKLSTDSVSTNQIQNSAVTEGKIATGAITNTKIASGSITSDKLSTDSVSTNQIQNSSVTSEKISDASVSNNKIQDGAVTEGKIATESVTGPKVKAGNLGLDRMSGYFVASGSETLTQPEFAVAGADKVIAEVVLTQNNPVTGAAADTFQPFILVSLRPSAPDPDAQGLPAVEYQGDISWRLVLRNTPPGTQTANRAIDYALQFQLRTAPQPPQQDGSPAPGDPAPAGSKVKVSYTAVFLKYLTQ